MTKKKMLEEIGELKEIQASTMKLIQASVEGQVDSIELESLLTGQRFNTSIPGTYNDYKNYVSQVRETYSKYNGRANFGVAQTRSVVDLRSAMISGEGISVITEDEKLGEWIDKFLMFNKLTGGPELFKAVKGTEMSGQLLLKLKSVITDENEVGIKIFRIGYSYKRPFRAVYADSLVSSSEPVYFEIRKKDEDGWERLSITDFVYVRTGGDDLNEFEPTTKVGVVLTDLENYDRAIKDMRRNNHIMARITPTFEVDTEQEAKTLTAKLNQIKWTIGKAFIGKAKFKYETPETGAHDNLKTEMVATIKNISAATGVPVHWLGYVDLMSNRSTADSLFEMIKQQTINERNEWEGALYQLIFKAQEMYIDAGGTDISLNRSFQVKLPLLDYSGLKERVDALSIAYHDEAISIDDYMNMLPGIDPYKTKKALEKERKEEGDLLLKKSKKVGGKTDLDISNIDQED